MALRTLRGRRRRERTRTASIAIMGAGGILAGTALAWLLSPRGAERRERAGRALRGAAERARTEAREVSARASEALHHTSEALHQAQGRLGEEAKAAVAQAGTLPERAREAADAVRARADRQRAALEARGWSPRQTALRVAGGALLGRAVLGRGLLRIPAGLLGASILARSTADSSLVRRGMRRTGEAAHAAAERLRAKGGAGAGAPRTRAPRPEVREVKSPGELEQGIATGRPDPTFAGRADRSGPHMGGRQAGPGRPGSSGRREEEGILSAPSTDDVQRRGGFDSPAAGAGVREGDLGLVMPHEGTPAEDAEAGESRIVGPHGERLTHRERGAGTGPTGERARREPGEDDGG